MPNYWLENASNELKHTIIDVGYLNSPEARMRADLLLEHVGGANLQIVAYGRLLIRIPPRKVARILKLFPRIKARTDDRSPGYCWCTHAWICRKSTNLKLAR